jgi:CBS domain-containing protein
MENETLSARSLTGIVKSAAVADAARLMVRKNIGALGIYSPDGHELIGIVTERDITRAVAESMDTEKESVTEVMSSAPVVVEGELTKTEAAELMKEGYVRHLIISDHGADRIVSIRDLL